MFLSISLCVRAHERETILSMLSGVFIRGCGAYSQERAIINSVASGHIITLLLDS